VRALGVTHRRGRLPDGRQTPSSTGYPHPSDDEDETAARDTPPSSSARVIPRVRARARRGRGGLGACVVRACVVRARAPLGGGV